MTLEDLKTLGRVKRVEFHPDGSIKCVEFETAPASLPAPKPADHPDVDHWRKLADEIDRLQRETVRPPYRWEFGPIWIAPQWAPGWLPSTDRPIDLAPVVTC